MEITAVVRGFAFDNQRIVVGFAGRFLREGGSQYQRGESQSTENKC